MKKKLLFVTIATVFTVLQNMPAADAQNWLLTGNSTATSASKLGTTKNVSLRLYTNNVRRVIIDSNGQVGIGIAKPYNIFNVQTSGGVPSSKWITQKGVFAGLGETTSGNSDILSGMASNTASTRALFSLKRARGTLTTPGAVKSNDYLGSFVSSGFDGTNFQYPANIDFISDADATSTNVPARIVFSTGTNSTTRTERLRVDQAGNFSFNSGQVYLNQSTGNLGIGTTSLSAKLQVVGGTSAGTGILVTGYDYGIQASSTYTYGYGVYGTSDFVGVYGYAVGGSGYGTYGSSGNIGAYGSGAAYGTYGSSNSGTGAYGSSSSGYGVQGMSSSSYGGYFVSTNNYGLVASSTNAYYAGVFYGHVYTSGGFVTSDKNLKKDIHEFGDAMSIINKLKPMNYAFKDDTKYASLNLPKGRHYGLLAQDIEQVLPNLVSEAPHELKTVNAVSAVKPGADGKPLPPPAVSKQKETTESIKIKAVNYVELIPIIIKAMQEQQTTIDKQNEKIEALTQLVNQLSKNNNSPIQLTNAALGSASPNPATKSTRISYSVPAKFNKAELVVYNAAGQKIKQTQLTNSGLVDIDTSRLSAGTYSYTLIVDGAFVDTKKMVIAR